MGIRPGSLTSDCFDVSLRLRGDAQIYGRLQAFLFASVEIYYSCASSLDAVVQRAACIAVIVALVTRAVLSCFSFFCELLNVLSLQQQQRVHSHSTSTPWRQRGLRSVCVVFGSDSVRVLRCERFLFGALRSRVAKVLRAVPFAAVAAWSRTRTVFTQM